MFRRIFAIVFLTCWCLCASGFTPARAHQFQVEPIVAVLRPQEKWVHAEFTGNVQDITQSVEAKPEDLQGDSFTGPVEQRVLAYFNERFLVEEAGNTIAAEWVSLTHQGGLDPTVSRFRLILRYPRTSGAGDGAGINVTNRMLEYLPNSRVILSTGGLNRSLAYGDSTTFEPGAFAVNLWRNVRDFAVLGAEHIFTGPDHMLFIVALLLVASNFRGLVKTLTGFTIAHSATLVLSALSIVVPNSRLVDIVVALSIVYVGAENIVLARKALAGGSGISDRHRFWVSSAFGLIHGFGFSGILREIGLPEGAARFWSLLSFNLGVEIAQVMLCAIAFPLVVWWRRGILARGAVGPKQWTQNLTVASALVILAGCKWLVERVFIG